MSLVNTRLQNFRAEAPNIDRFENRASRYGAYDLFRMQTSDPGGIISPDLQEKALRAIGSTLEVPVINFDGSVTIGSSFDLAITDLPNTSQLMSVTFTTYAFGFLIHPAAHLNNEISMQRDFNRKFSKCLYKLADTLDTAAVTKLGAVKTQVLADTLGGRYALTSNVIVAPLAEQNAVVGDLNPLMAGNDFYEQMYVVGNPSFESLVRNNLLEKGQFQDSDKRYQYNDKVFTFTNNISNGVGHKATGFVANAGSLGLLYQFEPDALMGNNTHKHQWGTTVLPLLNLPVGTYFYDDAVNAASVHGAASAHLTRTKVEAYGFAVNVAMVSAYNSDLTTIASPVAKFAVASS